MVSVLTTTIPYTIQGVAVGSSVGLAVSGLYTYLMKRTTSSLYEQEDEMTRKNRDALVNEHLMKSSVRFIAVGTTLGVSAGIVADIASHAF
jgi:hypothetical protein